MTALFGIVRYNDAEIDNSAVKLAESLRSYGPDDSATLSLDNVLFGRNLSIILDEDRFDAGPVHAKGARYVVVADVRLTERKDLAEQLGLTNAETLSDAAVVAQAIETWHEAAFDKIYGEFAVAAWDVQAERLLLARDHLGYRPLFYHRTGGRTVFASMPQGLHALPDVPRGFDADAIRRFLRYLQPSGTGSAYREIEQVRPGHYAVLKRTDAHQVRYWRPDTTPLQLDHKSYEQRLADQVETAVAAALRDVPDIVGTHLSSGFDSTTVATTAALQLANSSVSTTLLAFTAIPRAGYHRPDNAFQIHDEGPAAARTAALHANIEHVLVRPYDTPLETLDRTSMLYGAPLFSLSNEAWMAALHDEARRRGVTVMLQGSMGNASVSEPGTIALFEMMRAGRLPTWWRIARGLVQSGKLRWRGVLWKTLGPMCPDWLWVFLMKLARRPVYWARDASGLRVEGWQEQSERYSKQSRELHPLDQSWTAEFQRDPRSSIETRMQMMNFDLGSYYKAVLGRWGLDTRDPLGDRRLVEFSLRVPVEHLIWNGEPRAMLRRFLKDRAPWDIIEDDRHGVQAADWAVGLGSDLTMLRGEVDRIEAFEESAAIIDIERLRESLRQWDDVDQYGVPGGKAVVRYRYAMLRAISAANFMRRSVGSNI